MAKKSHTDPVRTGKTVAAKSSKPMARPAKEPPADGLRAKVSRKADRSITIQLPKRLATRDPSVLADEDIALYHAELPKWRNQQGKHVLIYGGKVHGFFATRDEARREGFKQFGHVAFLVNQVDVDEKPQPLVGVVL